MILIIGDFDSIKPEILQAYCAKGCAIKTYPSEKIIQTRNWLSTGFAGRGYSNRSSWGYRKSFRSFPWPISFLLVTYQSENCQIRIVGSDCIAWVTKDKAVVLGDPGATCVNNLLTRVSQGLGWRGLSILCNASIFMGSTRDQQ